MSILNGKISLHKRIRRHPVWNREPKCYAAAFADLLLLANDARRTCTIHGESFPVERGQLAWSMRALEKEWNRSGEWVKSFLKFCQNEAMLTVDSNRRRTVITILNYEAYNSTEPVTDTDTEPVTEPVTDTERNRESGRGIGNLEGGSTPPANREFAETPAEAEVMAEARGYPGDFTRSIPAGIPDEWTLGWFAFKSGSGFPKNWRAELKARFVSDWVSGNRKARPTVFQSPENKKNGARSGPQARFEISRELEEIEGRLDAAHETSVRPDPDDRAREKILRQELKALGESVQT